MTFREKYGKGEDMCKKRGRRRKKRRKAKLKGQSSEICLAEIGIIPKFSLKGKGAEIVS
jgi:hypothetical protein